MSVHVPSWRHLVGALGVLWASTVVEASVVSLKAVKKNDVAILPTNNLSVLPNDTIEAEIFLSGWANDLPLGVRVFRVTLAGRAGFTSGDNGTILPLGWCAPVDRINCTQSATCPSEYPICLTDPPVGCTCSPFNPHFGWFITASRPDFLLFGVLDYLFPPDVVPASLDYKYFGITENPAQAVTDTGVARYLGTLIVKVSANACGTFNISFIDDQVATFIADANPDPNKAFPTPQPLTLTVSDCVRLLTSCSPAHCSEDARIAHDPNNPAIRFNWNTIVMNFTKPTAGMTKDDFEATLIPTLPGDVLPSVSLVIPSGNTATILLSRRIQQERWTCVRDKLSNRRCCIGSLPGDVDGNLASLEGNDAFELLDNLTGGVVPPLAIEKCDIERSSLCTPADLLMVIDLANDSFPCEFDVCGVLPACPSFIPPP